MLKKEYNPFRLKRLFGERCIIESNKERTKFRGRTCSGDVIFTIDILENNICELKVIPHLGGEDYAKEKLITKKIMYREGEKSFAIDKSLEIVKKVAKSIKYETILLSCTAYLTLFAGITFLLGLAIPTIIFHGFAGLTCWLYIKEKEHWGRESTTSIIMAIFLVFNFVQIALIANVI